MSALRTFLAFARRWGGPVIREALRLLGACAGALGIGTLAFLVLLWLVGPGEYRPAGLTDLEWQLLTLGAVLYMALPLAAGLVVGWLLVRAARWAMTWWDARYWRLHDQREQTKAQLRGTAVTGG